MLVLAAAYSSTALSQLVDGCELETLLKRTILKLRESQAISPTLKMDAQILEYVRKKLFEGGGSKPSSFSFPNT